MPERNRMMISRARGPKALRIAATVMLFVFYSLALIPGSAMAGGRDSDGDGMPNRWETAHGLNPHKANGGKDADKDSLKNVGEYKWQTDPQVQDSDDDGVEDGDEVKTFDTDPTDDDTDDDGIEDGNEDGDDDGIDDEDEDDAELECTDDVSDDGTDDVSDDDSGDDSDDECDDEATEDDDDVFGAIESFDSVTGVLTITSNEGDSLTADVTDETELKWDGDGCEDAADPTTDDLTVGAGVTDFEIDDSGVFEELELDCIA